MLRNMKQAFSRGMARSPVDISIESIKYIFDMARNRYCRRGRDATNITFSKTNSLFCECVCIVFAIRWSVKRTAGLILNFSAFFAPSPKSYSCLRRFLSAVQAHTPWVGIMRIIDTEIGCCKYTSQNAHTRRYCSSDVSLIRTEA